MAQSVCWQNVLQFLQESAIFELCPTLEAYTTQFLCHKIYVSLAHIQKSPERRGQSRFPHASGDPLSIGNPLCLGDPIGHPEK